MKLKHDNIIIITVTIEKFWYQKKNTVTILQFEQYEIYHKNPLKYTDGMTNSVDPIRLLLQDSLTWVYTICQDPCLPKNLLGDLQYFI